ncbi:ABC-2 type transport system ATP-binding protein [Aequitasia blattaphilus]|uniref:ATP-binding cassette domain-containing protein n=1 Tax=Aequitasia blattaphilus TaxID=2949332 RepID=A0ABT1EBK5_9FIRM|nr:ATP-binding cassette domain-containing protein [Aequitasia blattaphilus]MCP1103197.1 ATP-binding cassette domain-containing protein [Aequitasia blattaphilus]MCR8615837.1 ATP-binding cassette domain-containing protein [Aequitasia blattaphilus]
MNSNILVQAKDLVKTFHGREVISHCDMCVKKGTIYGFLGENGAGKTTVLKMLMGLLTPTSGKIEIGGGDLRESYPSILKKIGSIIETPIFYEHLTATENLALHLSYMQLPKRNIEESLQLVGLHQAGQQPVSEFSLGMKQRLGIARSIVHCPTLLLLDEPINGLDPMGIRQMRELFLTLVKEKNMTIIISSHILSEIEQMADTIGVITNGRIKKEVTISEVKAKTPTGLEDYFFNLMKAGEQYV